MSLSLSNNSRAELEAGQQVKTRQRVRIPLFPKYSEVRLLLNILPGYRRRDITHLLGTVMSESGTPQDPVDWTRPDEWIPEKLTGKDQDLAQKIWTESKGKVNPRHCRGHWRFIDKYDLIEGDNDNDLRISKLGKDFIDHEQGEAERELDEQEGLHKLLSLVADNGPTRFGGILGNWSDYLQQYSSFSRPSTFSDTMRRRLSNLLDRNLIEKSGGMYSITEKGLSYFQRRSEKEADGQNTEQEIRVLTKKLEQSVKEDLLEWLCKMPPLKFENLVKQLLEEMGYENVEVTSPSGDGGVDVIGDMEVGITKIREVVQAKRHARTIQRKDLDALRGSLHRFEAVRGTIISTSNFSRGTKQAAFDKGVAPITLIDGKELVNLLIKNNIGVRKRNIDVLELNIPDEEDIPEEEESEIGSRRSWGDF